MKEVKELNETTEAKMAREAANRYKREWAKKNPERVKAAQMRYWAKRYQEMQEQEEKQDAGKTD